MERSPLVRNPHDSTVDLLSWSDAPSDDLAASPALRSSFKPSDGISKVVFGGQITDEEVGSLNKRKPCSGYKMKEMTGNGIFAAKGAGNASESGTPETTQSSRTGLRMYQQAVAGISHISFSEEEGITPKKPTSMPEMAKQRELTGTLVIELEDRLKQISDAKCKELSGHDIFAPQPEIIPRPTTIRPLAPKENLELGQQPSNPTEGEIKTAKKLCDKKFTELSGNAIFEGVLPSSAEKPSSSAKIREMSGNNIFADGKTEHREFLGGVRKPPGGESSIALV